MIIPHHQLKFGMLHTQAYYEGQHRCAFVAVGARGPLLLFIWGPVLPLFGAGTSVPLEKQWKMFAFTHKFNYNYQCAWSEFLRLICSIE